MRNAITILDEAVQAQLAAKVYRHIVMLAKPPAQAFADLHERKRKHAENRAKHPPKPKPEAQKEEKPLDNKDKTTPKSKHL